MVYNYLNGNNSYRKLNILSFFLGITSILEVFRVKVGPLFVNISDVVFFVFIIVVLLPYANRKRACYKYSVKYLMLSFFIVLSFSLNCLSPILDSYIYPDIEIDGITPSIKYSAKTFLNVIFFFLLLKLDFKQRSFVVKYFVLGFISSLCIHILYSSFQMYNWYFLEKDIHSAFLSSFGLTEEEIGHSFTSFVIWPVMRATGLYWDAYYMGFIGTISMFVAMFIKNRRDKYIVYLLIVANWFLSFSRTGYISALCTLLLIYCCRKQNLSLNKLFNYSKLFKSIISFAFVGIISLSVFVTDDLYEMLSESFAFKSEVKEHDEGDMRHVMYPVYAVEAVIQDPYHLFIGYGSRNSSKAIFMTGNITEFTRSKESFDIESDWCKMLINFGIICFAAYIILNVVLIKRILKQSEFRKDFYGLFFLATILCVFISGFFYAMNDARWVWMVYFMAILYVENNCRVDYNDSTCNI